MRSILVKRPAFAPTDSSKVSPLLAFMPGSLFCLVVFVCDHETLFIIHEFVILSNSVLWFWFRLISII